MVTQKQNNTNTGGGIGFVGALTITFVVLKALGYLKWSWWWVFAPLWISWGIVLAILIVIFLVWLVAVVVDERARSKRRKARLEATLDNLTRKPR